MLSLASKPVSLALSCLRPTLKLPASGGMVKTVKVSPNTTWLLLPAASIATTSGVYSPSANSSTVIDHSPPTASIGSLTQLPTFTVTHAPSSAVPDSVGVLFAVTKSSVKVPVSLPSVSPNALNAGASGAVTSTVKNTSASIGALTLPAKSITVICGVHSASGKSSST